MPIRCRATVAELLAGDPVEAVLCADAELDLEAGTHRLTTRQRARGCRSTASCSPTARRPAGDRGADTDGDGHGAGRTSRDVTVDGCPDGCWLVLGEGFHDAWSASADGRDLGPPQLVDGGFNGWRIAAERRAGRRCR